MMKKKNKQISKFHFTLGSWLKTRSGLPQAKFPMVTAHYFIQSGFTGIAYLPN